MGINHSGSGQPDSDLEAVHEEVFGLKPQDIGIPLSYQGLKPVVRRQPESASVAPAEPAEGQA